MDTTNFIFVASGEVKAASAPGFLISSGIGSCVVISAYCRSTKFGVMAHVMLPGRVYPHKLSYKNRYAFDAIDTLLQIIEAEGYQRKDFTFTLVGGANVIPDSKVTIGKQNCLSIKNYLKEKDILLAAESLGGLQRRTTRLDLEQGISYFSMGNQIESKFYDFNV